MKKVSSILVMLFVLSLCSGIASAEILSSKLEKMGEKLEQVFKSTKVSANPANAGATREERAAALRKYGFPESIIEEYSEPRKMLLIYEDCKSGFIVTDVSRNDTGVDWIKNADPSPAKGKWLQSSDKRAALIPSCKAIVMKKYRFFHI